MIFQELADKYGLSVTKIESMATLWDDVYLSLTKEQALQLAAELYDRADDLYNAKNFGLNE